MSQSKRPREHLAHSYIKFVVYFQSTTKRFDYSIMPFASNEIKLGDTVRLKNLVWLRITKIADNEISGHALFPFERFANQDDFQTSETGKFVLEPHRQPCKPAEDETMVDAGRDESLTELRGPLSAQTCDGRVLASVYLDTPAPPVNDEKLEWDWELVWVKFYTNTRSDHRQTQDMMVAPVSDIREICKVAFTNLPRPYHPPGANYVCRYKYVSLLSNGPDDRSVQSSFSEKSLCLLAFDEADSDVRIGANTIRRQWADARKRMSRRDLSKGRSKGRVSVESYTFGDAFCGGGGVSRGAENAGLLPSWGFDSDEDAMEVYKANFGSFQTECLPISASDFLIHASKQGYGVDVVHASPPCQRFVSMNPSKPDERDYENIDTVAQLLKTTKPRILTIEEVFEFGSTPLFDRLLCGILGQGYSVRWKIANCCDFGVPQKRRRRLILIASA